MSSTDISNLSRPLQPMTPLVSDVLEERELFTAHKSRPPYQQNNYLSWINRAKRAETGKAGPLFYNYVIAFNPALVSVLVAATLETL